MYISKTLACKTVYMFMVTNTIYIKIFDLWDDLLSLGKHSQCVEGLKYLDLQGEVAQEDEGTSVPRSTGKYICTQRHVAPSQKT